MLRFIGRGSAFTDEHNCAYLEHGGDLYLFDCPMSAFTRLKKWDLGKYGRIIVLVTHTHGDHSGGIGMLIDYCFFVPKTPVIVAAPSEQVREDLAYFLGNIEGCNDTWYELTTVESLNTDLGITAIPTTHTAELQGKCFGYCVDADGKRIVYTGDTNTLDPFEGYLLPGTFLYTEASAYDTKVHISAKAIAGKLRSLGEKGVLVHLMHMDDEAAIEAVTAGTGAVKAPLDTTDIPEAEKIFSITDSLYRDMCMTEQRDHAKLFAYLTDLGKTIVGADRGSFWKWDRRRKELWTMSATGVDRISIPDDSGLVGKALRTKKVVITDDPYSDPDFNPEVDRKTGYVTRSVLVLPVADINGNFTGALQLINKAGDKGFDGEDERKLSLAALICGIALESETFLEESHRDKLTGLRNRMGFYYDFGGRLRDYLDPDSGKKMSIFICDIDKFKRVNDTYGHNAGDDVLAFASGIIASSCTKNDSVYRWGGEEFVMVRRDTDLEGAVERAEQVRVKLMGSDIDADGNTIRCTMSFGVASFDPRRTIEENISVADGRLYTAKETGRNRVCSEDQSSMV